MIFIFDLDHTVIDSTHRQLTLPDGSLDLANWLENCTEHKIMADTLLPLADVMRRYFREGHTIVVCTARSGDCLHDRAFMYQHGLQFHHWLSRGDSQEPDATLKTRLLDEWATSQGLPDNWRKDACCFDDNVSVIREMLRKRLMCFDAIKYNSRLKELTA